VLDKINFLHNTFVDCGMIDFGGTGATNGTWANNIFKKTGTIFQNANTGTTFKGNIYSGTLGITIPVGMTNLDPKLALNPDGYYGLTSTSPAIDAANATYPAILDVANIDDDPTLLLDIKGLPRTASAILKDVGCEEYNVSGTVLNRPLKLADVGPTYLKPITTIINPLAENFDFNATADNSNHKLKINFTQKLNSPVSLSLYNLNGILLKTLFATNNTLAGNHTEIVDIQSINSGIYIITFSTNEFSKSKKVIVL
jgi:hypothetical protein